MAPPTSIRVGGKVNLFLRIVGRRDDGYHELQTLFLPVAEPHDVLHVAPAEPGAGLRFSCDRADLAGPENLVVRAYEAFARSAGGAPDVEARLEKGIPAGAGLGGGSADAAAMLRWLNQEAEAGRAGVARALAHEEMNTLAASLGADVPVFLLGGPAWATGIGEVLTPARAEDGTLPAVGGMHLLVACPACEVSTAWAYGRWDEVARPDSGFLTELGPQAMYLFCFRAAVLYNSFEQVVFPAYPQLGRLKQRLLTAGAAGALMGGSGAAVFGLFRRAEDALTAAGRLEDEGVTAYIHRIDAGVSPSW